MKLAEDIYRMDVPVGFRNDKEWMTHRYIEICQYASFISLPFFVLLSSSFEQVNHVICEGYRGQCKKLPFR